MMTKEEEEFTETVKKAITKLNKESKNEHAVFVFVIDSITEEADTFGYGCPACAAELIHDFYELGNIEHVKDSVTH